MMGTLFLAFFPCRIWPAPNQAAPACPRQARNRASPGRRGLITTASAKPNPVPVPKNRGQAGCKVARKPHFALAVSPEARP